MSHLGKGGGLIFILVQLENNTYEQKLWDAIRISSPLRTFSTYPNESGHSPY